MLLPRLPQVLPADTVNPVRSENDLLEGWHVVEMWECEFHDFLQRNTVAKTYVDNLKDIVDPLNPRDAFYGGRVNATKLLVKTESTTTKIKYVDFPGHQQERCVPCGSPNFFHGEYSP